MFFWLGFVDFGILGLVGFVDFVVFDLGCGVWVL